MTDFVAGYAGGAALMFALLFSIWSKNDFLNLILKVVFCLMSLVGAVIFYTHFFH
jgi:hypothetical protein